MTIGYLETAWKGVAYVAAKTTELLKNPPSESNDSENQVKPLDLTKLVETISASIFIGMLAMKKPGTRIRIAQNTIFVEEPSWTTSASRTYAWYVGNDDTANRKVFKAYRIFDRIIMAHSWYSIGTDGAIAIAKIHKITTLATVIIEKMYEDDYITDHLAKNRKILIEFIRNNLPEKETKELIKQIKELRKKLDLPPDKQLSIKKDPVIEMTLSKKHQEPSLSNEAQPHPAKGGGLDGEPRTFAPSEVGLQDPLIPYDSEDDLLSDISEEDQKIVAVALDPGSSNLMKGVYSVRELASYADRMETAWEHFQHKDSLIREQVPDELESITKNIMAKVKLYQQKLNRDLQEKYFHS